DVELDDSQTGRVGDCRALNACLRQVTDSIHSPCRCVCSAVLMDARRAYCEHFAVWRPHFDLSESGARTRHSKAHSLQDAPCVKSTLFREGVRAGYPLMTSSPDKACSCPRTAAKACR